MENQGKRLMLAVVLALGVMLAWNTFFPSDKPTPPEPTPAAGSAAVGSAGAPTPAAPIAVEPPCTSGELTTLKGHDYTAKFSTCGGSLVSWKLANEKFERDATKGEMLTGNENFGSFYVGFWGSTIGIPRNAKWIKTAETPTSVSYKLDAGPAHLQKTFTIYPDYLVKMAVTYSFDVAAGTIAKQRLAVTAYEYQDPKTSTKGQMQVAARVWASSTFRGDEVAHSSFKDITAASRHEMNVKWTGFEHPYLVALFAPHRQPTDIIEKFTRPATEAGDGYVRTVIVFPEEPIQQGTSKPVTREVAGFLGPKAYHSLDAADAHVGFVTGLTQAVDLGWFAFIGRPLLWLMLKFYAFLGNWGLAIILLTFLVKAATIYWTTKSMRSMKKMAALAPQMKLLQEKYKDDRQRMQVETMALYKQHSVNPIAGCLPIFLQMPIWIALYRMLSSAGELYQEPFIKGWIDDLTATDPYYILPVILVVTMFAQARLTPQTGDSRQQKFLQYGMPLMFGVMSFFFPAGLTLYIFTNTVLSALHSLWMNKFDKKSLEAVAMMKKATDEAEAKKAAAAKPAGGKSSTKTPAPKAVIDVEDESTDKPAGTATAVSPPKGGPKKGPNNKKGRR